MNWFLITTCILYVGAAGWEFYRHDYAVGIALICWGLGNLALAWR